MQLAGRLLCVQFDLEDVRGAQEMKVEVFADHAIVEFRGRTRRYPLGDPEEDSHRVHHWVDEPRASPVSADARTPAGESRGGR